MFPRNRIEFLERELAVGELPLVFGRVVYVALTDALSVAFGYQFNESIL